MEECNTEQTYTSLINSSLFDIAVDIYQIFEKKGVNTPFYNTEILKF